MPPRLSSVLPQGDRSITFQLLGAQELADKFRQLSRSVEKQAAQRALSHAARFYARKVKAAAPRGKTGNLRKSIRPRQGLKKYFPSALVVAARPLGAHAHLIERGTKQRKTKSSQNRGRVKANPFFRREMQSNANARFAATIIARSFSRDYDRLVKVIAGRGGDRGIKSLLARL